MYDRIHAKYLHQLSHEIVRLDLRREDIDFILVEPHWYDELGHDRSLCDMIVGMHNGYAIPVELKSNKNLNLQRALKQIAQGVTFAHEVLHRRVNYGLLMLYDRDSGLYRGPENIVNEELLGQVSPDLQLLMANHLI